MTAIETTIPAPTSVDAVRALMAAYPHDDYDLPHKDAAAQVITEAIAAALTAATGERWAATPAETRDGYWARPRIVGPNDERLAVGLEGERHTPKTGYATDKWGHARPNISWYVSVRGMTPGDESLTWRETEMRRGPDGVMVPTTNGPIALRMSLSKSPDRMAREIMSKWLPTYERHLIEYRLAAADHDRRLAARAAVAARLAAVTPGEAWARDDYGRPMRHDHYGRDPLYAGRVELRSPHKSQGHRATLIAEVRDEYSPSQASQPVEEALTYPVCLRGEIRLQGLTVAETEAVWDAALAILQDPTIDHGTPDGQ